MGDKTRNRIFALQIQHRLPVRQYQRILVVADGNGELSFELAKLGYTVHMVEPKPRHLHKHPNITRSKCYFTENFSETVPNIIVGMHPDEATLEILFYARKHRIPAMIVPCCVKALQDKQHYLQGISSGRSWINQLKNLAGGPHLCETFNLPITGSNVVLHLQYT